MNAPSRWTGPGHPNRFTPHHRVGSSVILVPGVGLEPDKRINRQIRRSRQ